MGSRSSDDQSQGSTIVGHERMDRGVKGSGEMIFLRDSSLWMAADGEG